MMHPIFDELSLKYKNVVFLRVEGDQHRDISSEYGISGFPTFVFVYHGDEVDRIVGADPEGLESKIQQYAQSAQTFTGTGNTLGGETLSQESVREMRLKRFKDVKLQGSSAASGVSRMMKHCVVARQQQFDIIHAHDWLTYPAGVHAKMVSGKPLCIHVHATDFDRSRGKVNPTVYATEKNGMDYADCIMCVSELTRQTVIREYHQDPRKCFAMHNAVYPLSQELLDIPRPEHKKEKVVTFLGRITMQKGPEYFVEAAALVLKRTRNIRFIMAGSGDMLDAMINLAAERGIADRFHFPGFQRGRQVYEAYKNSDVFVMPSVSEPFGIAPLEAMQCGTPSIISKQSGCGEILDKVIKTDYWDIHAMADAIYSICTNPSLFEYLQVEGKKEVDGITWEKVGLRIRALYENVLKNYGK